MVNMISVVVPVYNEEQNIKPLHANISEAMEKTGKEYEIIYVDDGSTDRTYENLEAVHAKSKKTMVIRFATNRGKTMALGAAFDNCSGDIIITMDGDLQSDANDIPVLLKKLDEGYDVISGWRYSRKDDFVAKKLPSIISNFIARKLTGVKIHDFNCPLKAYRKSAIDSIGNFGGMYGDIHRYLPAIMAPQGFKVTEVKVRHFRRKFGKSKYGIARLLKGPLDLIYIKFWSNYSARPLHFFGMIGIWAIIAGFVIAFINLLYHFVIEKTIFVGVGPLLLLSALLVLVGMQFIALGFISEIMISSYYTTHEKTPYRISSFLKKGNKS
jgi:glycosyltransferase involved in cell wall biosynthesis